MMNVTSNNKAIHGALDVAQGLDFRFQFTGRDLIHSEQIHQGNTNTERNTHLNSLKSFK